MGGTKTMARPTKGKCAAKHGGCGETKPADQFPGGEWSQATLCLDCESRHANEIFCPSCDDGAGRFRPFSDFYKLGDWYRRPCKDCHRTRAGQEARQAHRKEIDGQDMAHCARHDGGAGRWLPVELFGANRSRTDGITHSCRECTAEIRDESRSGKKPKILV